MRCLEIGKYGSRLYLKIFIMLKFIKLFLGILIYVSCCCSIVLGQCGNDDSSYVNPYSLNDIVSNSTTNRKSITDLPVRMYFWMVKDDLGNGRLTKDIVDPVIDEVVSVFSDYGIEIDPCLKQLNDSDRYNSRDAFERFYSRGCSEDAFHMALYENGVPGIGGQAFINGTTGWAFNAADIIIHEIGHLFGLVHTFNKCGSNDSECMSHYCADNQSDDYVDHFIDFGDFLCDTPALSHDDTQGNGCSWVARPKDNMCDITEYIGSQTDRCGGVYYDPTTNGVITNYMSYFDICRATFSKGQQLKMHHDIALLNSEKIGAFNSCEFAIVGGPFETGNIVNKNLVITDTVIYMDKDLIIRDSRVEFRNCTLFFEGSGGQDGFIYLNNSRLLLDGTTITSGNSCDTGFFGIDSNSGNSSSVSLWNGSVIKGEIPIINSNSGKLNLLGAGDFTLESTIGTAISGQKPMLIYANGGKIKGSITLSEDDVTGFFSTYSVVLRDCELVNTGNGFQIGLNLKGSRFAIWNTSVTGFSRAIESKEAAYAIVDGCHIESATSNNRPGVDVSFSLNTTLNNNHIIGSGLSITETAGLYQITRNNLAQCNGPCDEKIFLNGSNSIHVVNHNIIDSPESGLKSVGLSNSKFLCNEFKNNPVSNFDWEGVNMLQGSDNETSSGNLFSLTGDQIDGVSPSTVIYNFDPFVNAEILLPGGVNTLVFGTPVTNGASCGMIGPNWVVEGLLGDCPVGIDCAQPCPRLIDCTSDCPDGINCKQPCPFGIDCTQPCPEGIDCTQPCPAGINCEPDCPLGIDCTQPCPPGIDCTMPCPDGINCTEPCPPNVNCHEPCPPGVDCFVGCPSGDDCIACPRGITCDPVVPPLDPVLELVDSEYRNLGQERNEIVSRLYNNSMELDEIINNQVVNRDEFIAMSKVSDKSILPRQMRKVVDNSVLYTREEFYNILINNPVTLFNNKINNRVFLSESFDKEQLQVLSDRILAISDGDMVDLWKIRSIEQKQDKLLSYALNRAYSYGQGGNKFLMRWLERLPKLESIIYTLRLKIETNDFEDIESLRNEAYQLNLDSEELTDFEEYLNLFEVLLAAKNEGRNLDKLNTTEIEFLQNIALGGQKYSRAKAQNVLSAFYDQNFDQNYYSVRGPGKLDFLQSQITSTTDIGVNTVSIFPNPSRGEAVLHNNAGDNISIEIRNMSGDFMYKALNLGSGQSRIDLSHLQQGIYNVKFSNNTGSYISVQKLILVK